MAPPAPNPFAPETLKQLVALTLPPPKGRNIAVVGTVDSSGAQIVAGFSSKDGRWEVTGSYQHDWTTGDNAAAGKLMFTW